jgi:c-di-GMP-related signal transduction protein
VREKGIISTIIQQNVTIATKLLQFTNSSIYDFGATSALPRALMIIEIQALRDIVLIFSIINQLDWTSEQKFYLEMISLHSLSA